MPILPVNFYKFASDLYLKQGDEVDSRVIIGRAYYSVFLSARDSAGIVLKGSDSHLKLSQHYRKKNTADSLHLANTMDQLRASRITADYELDKIISRKDLGSCLKKAEKMLALLGVSTED